MPTSSNGNTLTLARINEHFHDEKQLATSLKSCVGLMAPSARSAERSETLVSWKRVPTRRNRSARASGSATDCEQFSATVGTVFEDSHIPMHRWLLIAYLMCASKKGMSAHQIHRMTGISYKTVWFMCHRPRFAMTQHGMFEKLRGLVEIDETYVGPKKKGTGLTGLGRPESKKRPVVSLMERSENGSRVRSFHVERVTLNNIKPIMRDHVEAGTIIQTDEATVYHFLHDDYPDHDVVTHKKKEYSRYENGRHITTNTVEGFFGLVKRGVYGTYHHWGRGYMQQYLNEFDFKFNHRKVNDSDQALLALKATEGKRLTLRQPKSASA